MLVIILYLYYLQFRFKCKEFGKWFVTPEGSFYEFFEVSCQANRTWTSNKIPDICECKYQRYQHGIVHFDIHLYQMVKKLLANLIKS